MSASTVDVFLARLYTDAALRESFLRDPVEALSDLQLTADERCAILMMDRAGLQMAATSFAHKRAQHGRKSSRQNALPHQNLLRQNYRGGKASLQQVRGKFSKRSQTSQNVRKHFDPT